MKVEGVLSPHMTVFTRQTEELEDSPHLGLALGVHHTRDFLVDEICTLTMVNVVTEGVRSAIAIA